jgi:hypothetical protein
LELLATDDAGRGRQSGKHHFFHSLELHPTSWLDVGVFETVITGRLELLSFLPASAYFHSQAVIETTWQAGASLRFTFDIGFTDDRPLERDLGSVSAGVDVTWQWQDHADLVAGQQRQGLFVGGNLRYRW